MQETNSERRSDADADACMPRRCLYVLKCAKKDERKSSAMRCDEMPHIDVPDATQMKM